MRRVLLWTALTILLILPIAAKASDSLPRHGLLGAAVTAKGGAIVVTQVLPDSASAAAGIETGDKIVSVDGTPVSTTQEFLSLVRRPAGKSVRLIILRDGVKIEKDIVMRAPPDETGPGVNTLYESVPIDGSLRRELVTAPDGSHGRLPGVFLIGGIGCYTVDTANAQDPYRNVAQDLSRHGFVVLRLEKSGIGDSQGPPCATVDFDTEFHSYDVALQAFIKDTSVDPKRVYLFGHSIGSVIAPRLAEAHKVAGIIIAEGVGVNWFQYELLNTRRQLALGGSTPTQVDDGVTLKEFCMHRYLIEKEALNQLLTERPACSDYTQYPVGAAYMQQIAALNIAQPWTKLDVPVLAIYGLADFVTAESDHRTIVNANHPGYATLDIIPNMNHDLSIAASQEEFWSQFVNGTAMTYNPAFSDAVLAWLCHREHCS